MRTSLRTSHALIAVASLAAAATVQSQTLRPYPASWGLDAAPPGLAAGVADPWRPTPLRTPLLSLYQRNLLDSSAPGLRPTTASTLAVDIVMATGEGNAAPSLNLLRNPDLVPHASSATRFGLGPQLTWRWSDDTAQSSWRVALPLQGAVSAQGTVAPRSFSLGPELIYERRTSSWRYGASLGAQLGRAHHVPALGLRIVAGQHGRQRPGPARADQLAAGFVGLAAAVVRLAGVHLRAARFAPQPGTRQPRAQRPGPDPGRRRGLDLDAAFATVGRRLSQRGRAAVPIRTGTTTTTGTGLRRCGAP